MTYFGFLFYFVGIPLILFTTLHIGLNLLQRPILPNSMISWPPIAVLFAHVFVAVAYTTPWDNYLVATNVWWYDPNLITGILIGYVPIEEYTFFVVQTLFSGLFMWLLLRVWPTFFDPPPSFMPNSRARTGVGAAIFSLWVISTLLLLRNTDAFNFNYMGLILTWALIPIGIQIYFGADILWHYRRIVFTSIFLTTLYLSAADAIAIHAGTWSISPDQTMGVLFFNILPFEEFLFFLITNVLVIFGMTLVLSRYSHERTADWMPRALQLNTTS